MTDWDDDILSMEKTDEDIIELTEIVKEGVDPAAQENIIELTDIVEDGSADVDMDVFEDGGIDVDLDFVEEAHLKGEETLEIDDEISFDEGFELEIGDPGDDVPVETEEIIEPAWNAGVSQEQLEAALERVIEKQFSDKIETILFEVMEKVMEREIVKIKESLQKDLDQMGNV